MKRWLRGGLILAGVYALISIIFLLLPGENYIIFYIISISDAIPFLTRLFAIDGIHSEYKIILLFILNFIIYFIIGSLIGLLISKFRNKENLEITK